MPQPARPPPITNRLLDRLRAAERGRVLEDCDEVELRFAEVLAEPGDAIRHVYFPTRGFISLLAPLGGKDVIEVALAGNEGLYGLPLALGGRTTPVRALVQGGGASWRMGAAKFRGALAGIPRLRACVDGYANVLMDQLIRTAACNRFHVVEQRVARWMLMTADRAHATTFPMTHAFLAYMLGVRRVGITEAAGSLQRRGLIGYTRGAVTIMDRRGLERAACSCYRADLDSYERVLGS